MKVFISWSGDRSKAVAEVLDEWLQCVLQAIDPWMSSKDIDRGSLWFSELSDQLADTKLGIVCLTQDNKNKPWILFEAGALAKGLSSSRVCTFLIDLEPTDVGNPLAQFNHSFPSRDGVYDLLRTINSCLGDKALKESVLEKVFETYWPQFEEDFTRSLELNPQIEPVESRSKENMLLEVLTSVRRLDRRMRDIEMRGDRQGELFESRDDNRLVLRVHPDHARRMISNLHEQGLPGDSIVMAMSDKAPENFVRKVIRELDHAKAAFLAVETEDG